jgi:hypothetical protein
MAAAMRYLEPKPTVRFYLETNSTRIKESMMLMRRIFWRLFFTLIVPAMAFAGPAGQPLTQGAAEKTATLQGYPIAADVETTLQRTVVPDLPSPTENVFPYEIIKYKKNGYGNWHFGPGLPAEKRLDIISTATNNGASVTNVARLMNFLAITDAHLDDKESPNHLILSGYKGGNSAAYSPVMLLTTQVLDAAIRTANALHKKKPFDFAISLGDDANGPQYNELRWFIDILDGKNINPDSGEKDDPIPGPYNDYQDRYKAAGLDKTIPWFQALGNHDHFWLGACPANDYLRGINTGDKVLLLGNFMTDGINGRTDYFYFVTDKS